MIANIPQIAADSVPQLTTEQMIEVDRAMVEDYGIQLIQMMENAGRNLARLVVKRSLAERPENAQVVVLAGSGGNGGGALVAARRLHAWGAHVEVALTKSPEAMVGVPRHQLDIVRRLGIAVDDAKTPASGADVIIDGVLGYSLQGAPRGRAATLLDWANTQEAEKISLDVPSGIDTTTGQIFAPAIVANATLTLALPKQGLFASAAQRHVGELYLGDISVPPQLYRQLGLDIAADLFATSDFIQLR